jgi:hypothetical protein
LLMVRYEIGTDRIIADYKAEMFRRMRENAASGGKKLRRLLRGSIDAPFRISNSAQPFQLGRSAGEVLEVHGS